MNIGIVTTWFERGAAYVSRQFMNILSKTDNVFIYARGGEKYAIGDPKWDLPNVYWSKRSNADVRIHGSMFINKKEFKKWIDINKIDIILFNEQAWTTPLIWCNEWKIPTIAYVDYYKENTIPWFNIYDAVLCNTKRHSFAFRHHPHQIYLKWGTDIDLYKPNIKKNKEITFFNSAGMSPLRKGTDLVIQAFYNIENRKNAKLLIHSQVSLCQKMPNLKNIIKELTEEGSLEIIEGTITAPGLFYRADVYVYPSRLDGIGLTLMEAAASGLACITVDNPPMNEFINSTFGVTCPVDYQYCRSDAYYWPMCVCNIDSLSKAMNDVINGHLDIDQMKLNARKYAENELNFDKNMLPLSNMIKTVKYRSEGKEEAKNLILQNENSKIIRLKKKLLFLFKLGIV
ncbi:MAG: glycosyltransferase family 4 protein [Muribaculaceae bacterium]|nr:glycosyltransferase family 4 protein [Muribaculaceae bacterium]